MNEIPVVTGEFSFQSVLGGAKFILSIHTLGALMGVFFQDRRPPKSESHG